MQQGADLLCHLRRIGSGVIALANLTRSDTRTLRTTSLLGVIYATDKVDGLLARGASRLLQRPCTDAGKTLDQKVDKDSHTMVMGSHIVDAWSRGERTFATALLSNMAVQLWRDRIVNRRRERAQQVARITDRNIHIGSVPASKGKMFFVAGGDIATQSSIARHPVGRTILGAVHCIGSALSLTSGAEVVRRLHGDTAVAVSSLPLGDGRRMQSEPLIAPTASERLLSSVGNLFVP